MLISLVDIVEWYDKSSYRYEIGKGTTPVQKVLHTERYVAWLRRINDIKIYHECTCQKIILEVFFAMYSKFVEVLLIPLINEQIFRAFQILIKGRTLECKLCSVDNRFKSEHYGFLRHKNSTNCFCVAIMALLFLFWWWVFKMFIFSISVLCFMHCLYSFLIKKLMKYQNTKFSLVAIHLFYQKVNRWHRKEGIVIWESW